MIKFLQSHSFAASFGVTLFIACSLYLQPFQNVTRINPLNHSPLITSPSIAWEFHNPEIDLLVLELKRERSLLAEREKLLNELAARLHAEQLELNTVTQSVLSLQRDLDNTIVRIHSEETANLKKLARVYATMSPDAAANILKQLDDPAIVKIMAFMKEDEAALILETLSKLGNPDSTRAASISERLRLAVFRNPSTP